MRSDVAEIEAALLACGALSKVHTYEARFERSAMRESTRPGYAFERDYTMLVLQDGEWKLRIHSVQHLE